MSFDIEEIIRQSDQSHAEESEEEDIGLLPIEEGILDESLVLEDEGESYHQRHHYQKNTASHRGRSLLVLMELGEDRGLLSRDSSFADGFS